MLSALKWGVMGGNREKVIIIKIKKRKKKNTAQSHSQLCITQWYKTYTLLAKSKKLPTVLETVYRPLSWMNCACLVKYTVLLLLFMSTSKTQNLQCCWPRQETPPSIWCCALVPLRNELCSSCCFGRCHFSHLKPAEEKKKPRLF